jgi:protein-tyrosine-phosphatase
MLTSADLVIAMDVENLKCLQSEFPEIAVRTTLLGLFGGQPALEIADPYLAEEAATNKICEQVRSGVDGLAVWIANSKASTSYTSGVPSTATTGR